MSRKDYIAIADALIAAYKFSQTDEEVHYVLLKDTITTLSAAFKMDNRSFDIQKFSDYIEERI